jgi:hypothetical protein
MHPYLTLVTRFMVNNVEFTDSGTASQNFT